MDEIQNDNQTQPLEHSTSSEIVIDYTAKSRDELYKLCKEKGIKGCSSKKKQDLIKLLLSSPNVNSPTIHTTSEIANPLTEQPSIPPSKQEVITGDTLVILPTLADNSAQIIIADPPYNIGKDFGNSSDKQPMDEYLKWCDKWLTECLRILKPNGTMFVYGFSEILALILARVPHKINRRWAIWHYTNKNVASLNFWQRSHESVLILWKENYVFHRDDVREAYTEGFLNGAAGKERTATKGRFSNGDKKTIYSAHPNGALPRDVIKIPALAGGAGMKERVDHPTQKPLALCEKLLLSCRQPNSEGYVLIPFAGSGSECVAAKKLDLNFIGIEINPSYVQLINQRLNPTQTEPQQLIPTEPAITEPAITEPAIAEPAIAEPAIAEPAIAEPAIAEPDTTK